MISLTESETDDWIVCYQTTRCLLADKVFSKRIMGRLKCKD